MIADRCAVCGKWVPVINFATGTPNKKHVFTYGKDELSVGWYIEYLCKECAVWVGSICNKYHDKPFILEDRK